MRINEERMRLEIQHKAKHSPVKAVVTRGARARRRRRRRSATRCTRSTRPSWPAAQAERARVEAEAKRAQAELESKLVAIEKDMNDKLAKATTDAERARIRAEVRARRRPQAAAATASHARPSHGGSSKSGGETEQAKTKVNVPGKREDRRRPARRPRQSLSGRRPFMSIGAELFEANRQRLLALLKRLSYEEREVTLASGLKSNFYIDCKQTVLTAEGHFLVGSLFGRVLAEQAPGGRGDRRRDDGGRSAGLGGVDAELRRRAAAARVLRAQGGEGARHRRLDRGDEVAASRACRSRSSRTS